MMRAAVVLLFTIPMAASSAMMAAITSSDVSPGITTMSKPTEHTAVMASSLLMVNAIVLPWQPHISSPMASSICATLSHCSCGCKGQINYPKWYAHHLRRFGTHELTHMGDFKRSLFNKLRQLGLSTSIIFALFSAHTTEILASMPT